MPRRPDVRPLPCRVLVARARPAARSRRRHRPRPPRRRSSPRCASTATTARPTTRCCRIAGITPGESARRRRRRGGRRAAAARAGGSMPSTSASGTGRSTTTSQVAVIIVVTERPGVEKGGVMPGPMKRVRNALMASPSLEYVDGYGVIAGGRVSFVNVLGKGGHIVVPLTAGIDAPGGGRDRQDAAPRARSGACAAARRSSAARTPATTSATCATTSGGGAPAVRRGS